MSSGDGAAREAEWLPHALYRAYADVGRMLYIGISVEPVTRWSWGHAHGPWAGDADHFSVTWYGDRKKAHAAEIAAIRAEHPVSNRQHSVCNCGRGEIWCAVCSSPWHPRGWTRLAEHRCPAMWYWDSRQWQLAEMAA